MQMQLSLGRKAFLAFSGLFIALAALSCVLPLINMLAISFSGNAYVDSGQVSLWPVHFTLAPYRYVLNNGKFWDASRMTLLRVLLGVPVNLILTMLAAYPLSKDASQFGARKMYVTLFLVIMVFNGGLVPTYILVKNLGLFDSPWALVLPCGLNVFYVVLMMNYFRGIPRAIEESALLDGAGQWTILFRLYAPLSMPSVATITLFALVMHWNSWMDGAIYMNHAKNYPLQTYLQMLINSSSNTSALLAYDLQQVIDRQLVGSRNLRAAQIFISILPIMAIYPLLQRYFITGIVMGSVKE